MRSASDSTRLMAKAAFSDIDDRSRRVSSA